MNENAKALLAKCWKNEKLSLETGTHMIDEIVSFRISGAVEKKEDQFVAPTVSIPWVAAVGLLLEKIGVSSDDAVESLGEAIEEAMTEGKDTERNIQNRMDDVEKAITLVREKLLQQLPKKKRAGSVITKDVVVETIETPATATTSYEPYVVLV
jgi:hypothetical protein